MNMVLEDQVAIPKPIETQEQLILNQATSIDFLQQLPSLIQGHSIEEDHNISHRSRNVSFNAQEGLNKSWINADEEDIHLEIESDLSIDALDIVSNMKARSPTIEYNMLTGQRKLLVINEGVVTPSETLPRSEHRQILVVEQSAFTNLAITQQLKVLGFECDTALKSAQAQHLIETRLQSDKSFYSLIMVDYDSAPSLAKAIDEMTNMRETFICIMINSNNERGIINSESLKSD